MCNGQSCLQKRLCYRLWNPPWPSLFFSSASYTDTVLKAMSCKCRLVIAANGVAYLPHAARPGIVPRLLQEILSTRIMVKGAMKSTPASHKVLQVSPHCLFCLSRYPLQVDLSVMPSIAS